MCIVLFDLDESWMNGFNHCVLYSKMMKSPEFNSIPRSVSGFLFWGGRECLIVILTTWSTDGFSWASGMVTAMRHGRIASCQCWKASVHPSYRTSCRPSATRVVLDVITPSDSGLTPEKWRCDATICPPNWPIDYRLLRGWYLSTNLHEFASGMFSPLQSWKLPRHAAFLCARNSNPCGSGCSGCHGVMLEMTMCASKQVHDLIHAPVS